MDALTSVQLPGVPKFSSGKVNFRPRERAPDLDCVLPTGIPDKGKVLTALSVHNLEEFPPSLRQFRELLDGRSIAQSPHS